VPDAYWKVFCTEYGAHAYPVKGNRQIEIHGYPGKMSGADTRSATVVFGILSGYNDMDVESGESDAVGDVIGLLIYLG